MPFDQEESVSYAPPPPPPPPQVAEWVEYMASNDKPCYHSKAPDRTIALCDFFLFIAQAFVCSASLRPTHLTWVLIG
jgi:hypothetical protein